MHHRAYLLLGFGLLTSAGLVGFACSSTPVTPGDDGGDSGNSEAGDAFNPADGPAKDSQPVVMTCPTYPLKGECDIVAQNCPNKADECIALNDGDGGLSLKCQTANTGSIPKGGKCSSTGQCVPGTECIQGRCAWHCCNGDDTPCGTSVPEGYIGTCNINLVDSKQNKVGEVCAYSADCTPFGLKPCPVNSTCLVQDMSGKATCSEIYNPPGLGENATCTAANECKDGMMCLGMPGKCTTVCYKGGGSFDAGVAKMDAGLGGCPMGKSCSGGIQNLPAWLGVCK
jgi:hypothetical protein